MFGSSDISGGGIEGNMETGAKAIEGGGGGFGVEDIED